MLKKMKLKAITLNREDKNNNYEVHGSKRPRVKNNLHTVLHTRDELVTKTVDADVE